MMASAWGGRQSVPSLCTAHPPMCLWCAQVLAFTAENKAVEQYNKKLDKAFHAGVHSSLAAGLGIGTQPCCGHVSRPMPLALWYQGPLSCFKALATREARS